MKRVLFPIMVMILLLIVACESPTNDDNNDIFNPIGSKFNRELLKDGNDYSVGYANGNIRSSKVTLTWTETDEIGFTSYQLTRDGDEIVTFNDISQTSFTDTLLSQNQEYFYQLNVITGEEMSVQDTLMIKSAHWEAPSNIQIDAVSQSAVKITWDDNSDTEDYFRIKSFMDNMFISSINVEANTTEAIFAGLEFGNNYSFKIVTESPYEDEIISSESLNFNLTLLSLEAPAYLEGHITSEQSVQLAWFDYSALETGFLVERKVNDGSFIEIATLSEMNLTSFVDRDISEFETGDLLTYRLKSYNDYEASIAFSDYSNEIVVEVEEISDDTIYIYFTSYNYFYTSWNIRKEGSNELVFPEFQTLDAPCQMMLRKVNLEAGKYYMHCLDTNGYGGIGGSVYQGTNLLTSWEIGSFVTNGHFHFEVTNK